MSLKTTMGDDNLLPSGGTCSRRSCPINFRSFATTNGNKCTDNSVLHNKRGKHFLLILNSFL